MKKTILGGAVAFALWGGAAFANEEMKQSESLNQDCVRDEAGMLICPEQQQGLGGAGEEGLQQDDAWGTEGATDELGTGGSETMGTESDLSAPEPADELGTGGSETMGTESDLSAPEPATEPEVNSDAFQPAEPQTQVILEDSDAQFQAREDSGPDMRGVQVFAGGGVEGYTGDLAPMINPGPSWGVGVAFKPWSAVGLELGYSGAVNGVEMGSGEFTEDADIIRNGGSAVATLGLGASPVQPYVLGGVGIDRYNVRDAEGEAFSDDTVGNVPVGVGLRTHVGNFVADLRGNYGILFNQGFATNEGNTNLRDIGDETPTGRFGAQLRLGATF